MADLDASTPCWESWTGSYKHQRIAPDHCRADAQASAQQDEGGQHHTRRSFRHTQIHTFKWRFEIELKVQPHPPFSEPILYFPNSPKVHERGGSFTRGNFSRTSWGHFCLCLQDPPKKVGHLHGQGGIWTRKYMFFANKHQYIGPDHIWTLKDLKIFPHYFLYSNAPHPNLEIFSGCYYSSALIIKIMVPLNFQHSGIFFPSYKYKSYFDVKEGPKAEGHNPFIELVDKVFVSSLPYNHGQPCTNCVWRRVCFDLLILFNSTPKKTNNISVEFMFVQNIKKTNLLG